jgi:hypothetical protein
MNTSDYRQLFFQAQRYNGSIPKLIHQKHHPMFFLAFACRKQVASLSYKSIVFYAPVFLLGIMLSLSRHNLE